MPTTEEMLMPITEGNSIENNEDKGYGEDELTNTMKKLTFDGIEYTCKPTNAME